MGRNGRNLQEMRNLSGVASIFMRGSTLTVLGTNSGAKSVRMKVQSWLNRFQAFGNIIKGEHLHFDLETSSFVKFVPADCSNLMVDPRLMDTERKHFVVRPVPSSTTLQTSSPLERTCNNHNKVTAPISVGLMCVAFQEFLENLSLIGHWERLIPGIHFGITFFHSLEDEIAKRELSVEEFLNLEPHTQYKPIFDTELLKMKIEDLTSKMTSLGFELREEDLSTAAAVYRKDAIAGAGCIVAVFQESLDAAAQLQPKATSLLQGGSGQLLAPAWLQRANTPQPPKTQRVPVLKSMVKFVDKYIRAQAIRSDGHLGFHAHVNAVQDADDNDVRKALEEAWRQGPLVPGDLHGDAVDLNIDTVKQSLRRTFSDGLFDITVDDISELSLRHAGKRTTYQVVKMTCPCLEKLIADMRKEMDDDVGGRFEDLRFGSAVDLFSRMVLEADKVSSKLSGRSLDSRTCHVLYS